MIRRILTVVSLLMFMTVPATANAVDLFNDACSSPHTVASAVCVDNKKTGDPVTGPNGIILKAANIIAIIAGVAAIIAIIIGGLKYVTSGGDSGGVSSAKQTILYALIGLIVIILARTIITFVIHKI